MRCDLEAKIQTVDNKVDVLRAELSAKIDGLNWKLTFLVGGFGLLLSVLTVVSGMGFFDPHAAGLPLRVGEPAPVAVRAAVGSRSIAGQG